MDTVWKLRAGLSGRPVFRYRTSRGRELSLSICLLLPVRGRKQDPSPGLVSTIALPIIRRSEWLVEIDGEGQHHSGMAFILESKLPLGRRTLQRGFCRGKRERQTFPVGILQLTYSGIGTLPEKTVLW